MGTPKIESRTVRTRREFLKATGLATASMAASGLRASAAPEQSAQPKAENLGKTSATGQSSRSSTTKFDEWKDRKVSELASRQKISFSPGETERHSIYSLALMAITLFYWNGNKYGHGVVYPLNEPISEPAGNTAGDYLGHNIAALITDADGHIIDFDFNHNEIFNSSVEHAESRLLRRVFSLCQIQDSWDVGQNIVDKYYATELKSASLYTTLESCAQCSGIMALARLKQVIFLQTDPVQYCVGNIMRNMTEKTDLQSPAPIPAKWFGFPYFDSLDEAYQTFVGRAPVKQNAMVLQRNGNETRDSYTTSITSFLCTKAARDIFAQASREFHSFVVQHEDWKPDHYAAHQLNNAGVFEECKHFVDYATTEARRGTPHRP
jgi:tRNA(Arg) A34 adenosine deaminase TadA